MAPSRAIRKPPPSQASENPPTEEELLEFAKATIKNSWGREGYEGHDAYLGHSIRPIHATLSPVPSLTCTMTVPAAANNSAGNFHGGGVTTLFDNLTSIPLFFASSPGKFQLAGVSRNLNVSFLRPIPVGSEIVIKCEVLSVGRRLALTKGEMRRKIDGVLLATCVHDKANTDPESKL